MVLVQRKRRRWGAFITLDGPALIAPIKADQQSAWRQEQSSGHCHKADLRYASVIGSGNEALDKREKQLMAVADQVEVMVSESAVASTSA